MPDVMSTHSSGHYVIYVDESGDLGFGCNGSRYLVIGALCIPKADDVLLKRFVRGVKKSLGLNGWQELKSIHSSARDRRRFCEGLARLPCQIRYIVINKRRVDKRLRKDTNILYNYAAQLLLSDSLAGLAKAELFLDSRTVRVGSGNSFPGVGHYPL